VQVVALDRVVDDSEVGLQAGGAERAADGEVLLAPAEAGDLGQPRGVR
jgi:hypothetical protein